MATMIDIDKLKNVKRLITHKNCPDGIASGLIIKDALPDVEVVFMSHGTEEHKRLEPQPGVLFCDFTPHIRLDKDVFPEFNPWVGAQRKLLKDWIEAGAICLDHHPTQRELTMKFVEAGLGAYGENDRNECGAWLAFEHVYLPLWLEKANAQREQKIMLADVDPRVLAPVRYFAELAGVRDTWKKDDPRWQEACEQAGELIFWGFEGTDLRLMTGPGEPFVSVGKKLFEKQLEHARSAIDEAHCFTTEKGTRVLLFQGVTPTSDAAEILEQNAKTKRDQRDELRRSGFGVPEPFDSIISAAEEMEQPNIVVGFHYRVDSGKLMLQFSTRSHTGYDVGAFCKSKGGGGHRAAAGFTVEQSAEVGANPYATFRLILEEWEQGQ